MQKRQNEVPRAICLSCTGVQGYREQVRRPVDDRVVCAVTDWLTRVCSRGVLPSAGG